MVMSLENVTKGVQPKPLRIVVYGVDGIGKSTFAAGAPDPIFLGAEDGTSYLDVARFPNPEGWDDFMQAFALLYNEEHKYKTLVVDTIDWAEDLAKAAVCMEHNVDGIEGLGYGKGYVYSGEKMQTMMRASDALVRKGLNVILLAHSQVTRFEDPQTEPYDRYTMKLHKSVEPKFREWPDAVLFANWDIMIEKEEKGFNKKRTRGVSMGRRILHTQRTAAWDAKNRFPGMPEQLPLDWKAFWDAYEKAISSAPF